MNPPVRLDPAAIARLQGLELRAQRIVEGYATGRHRSRLRGPSVEFAEHRDYAPGDDRRYVDWKAFAKRDRLYVKQFQAETRLTAYVAVDASESMAFRGPDAPLSKWEYAQATAAALVWIAVNQRDRAALAIFDRRLREAVSPGSTPAQIALVLDALQRANPQQRSDLPTAMGEVSLWARRRGVVAVVSDLLGDVAQLVAALRRLRQARHEVVVLHVIDPAEIDFPYDAPAIFRGLEEGPAWAVEPRAVRSAYRRAAADFLKAAAAGCRQAGADYQFARTDEPFDAPLRRLLLARGRGPRG